MNLTHNNHFKFGYDYEWFRFRQSPLDKWMVSYGACERPVDDFKTECLATAALIRDTTSEPLRVLLSGGSDSEIVVRSFHEQGIPFRAAICQFNDNLNIHDISFGVVLCQQLGVPFDLIQLNISKFLEGDFLKYAEPTMCRSPELCSTMWLADQVDGVPILGSGECYVVKRVPTNYIDSESPYERTPWDMYERELIASWYRHFMLPGKERYAVPGFFQYTPEIMLSFLRDERVVDLVNDRIIGKRSTMTSKMGIYQKYFPLADRKKYSGYEFLESQVMDCRVELRRRWPESGAMFLTEYNDLVDMLEGKLEGPKGMLSDEYYPPRPIVSPIKQNTSFIDETRQLTLDDYEQAAELIEERFATVIEFDRAKHKKFVELKHEDFARFKYLALGKWRNILAEYYLKGNTHKMFGSFNKGKLMSMVGMRLVRDDAWVLSNLRARDVKLSETGLKETMTMLYTYAKESGRTEYYCCVAEYRYKKFQTMMKRLVPDLYNEYDDEVLTVVEPGEQPENDFWWGMMGRIKPDVRTIIKKMKLRV